MKATTTRTLTTKWTKTTIDKLIARIDKGVITNSNEHWAYRVLLTVLSVDTLSATEIANFWGVNEGKVSKFILRAKKLDRGWMRTLVNKKDFSPTLGLAVGAAALMGLVKPGATGAHA